MPRQRFIHPEFWTDPTIGKLTPTERLFFIGCFSNADDDGRLLGNPAFLRATIFPYDDLTIEQVKDIRNRVIEVCNNLILYEVNDIEYLAFRKWNTYQKPKYPKPSNLPAPPSEEETKQKQQIGETFLQNRGKDSESLPENSSLGRDGFGMGLGRDDCTSSDVVKTAPGKPEQFDKIESETSTIQPQQKQEKTPYEAIIQLYHEYCPSLPRIQKLSEKRKKVIRTRWRADPDLAVFRRLFQKAEQSDFLSGRTGKWTGCNFDWLLNESNMLKVLEGAYDNKNGGVVSGAGNGNNTQIRAPAKPGFRPSQHDWESEAKLDRI